METEFLDHKSAYPKPRFLLVLAPHNHMPMPSPDVPSLSRDQIRELLDAAWACRRNDPPECVRASRQVLEQPLDAAELVRATLCLGCGLMLQGEFLLAEPELQRALSLSNDLADQESQRIGLNALGTVKARQGRPAEALELFAQVRQLHVTQGNVEGEIDALNNIGTTYSIMGDHPNAVHHQLLVLGLSREHGLPDLERVVLNNLSTTYNGMGRHHDALEATVACLRVQAGATYVEGSRRQSSSRLRN